MQLQFQVVFEGMEEDVINKLLLSHDNELDNDNLLSINIHYALEDVVMIRRQYIGGKMLNKLNFNVFV